MTTNASAYDRIRSAKVAANLGFSEATTAQASQAFLDIYQRLDDELDAMVAANLAKSSAAYKALTDDMKQAKKELEDIVSDIQAMVATTEAALKIVKVFAQVVAVL